MSEWLRSHSWKSTAAGVGALLMILGTWLKATFDGDPATVPPGVEQIAGSIAIALGLFAARDDKRSSEDVGAK